MVSRLRQGTPKLNIASLKIKSHDCLLYVMLFFEYKKSCIIAALKYSPNGERKDQKTRGIEAPSVIKPDGASIIPREETYLKRDVKTNLRMPPTIPPSSK